MKRLHALINTLFDKELGLEERLVRVGMALEFLASIIGMGRVLLGADPRVMLPLLAMLLVSGVCFWLTIKYRKTRLASWILAVVLNVVIFPAIFILSAGMESGTPIWLVLGIVYIFLLFQGKEFYIALAMSLVSFFITYHVSCNFPNVLSPAASRFFSFADSFVTLICVSCMIGFFIKVQTTTYQNDRDIIEKQKEEIEQIARSKDTFFANMSHEIRTPINTIIGLNEMTLREDVSDEIAENSINIQNASKMLLTTINDILDLSKLESGKMDIVPTQYEVSVMFSDIVNLIWIRAHQKELEFKVNIDREIPSMLYGDEVRIKQVITNILTNAVKYTREGSVTLSAKGERTAADTVLLRISVADTGIGIRKENLENLFRSFKRVDEKENRNIEGTGLGLTISKQLVEMMGGRIYVDSVYHKGSVFTVELEQKIVSVQPIGVINFAAQRKMSQRSRYKQSFLAPNARVLVVDDNSMNRMVATKLLRGTKIQVDTAASGRECLKMTATQHYHVILMDHMMPEMDGEETLKAVRSQAKGYCQKVPTLALTANIMSNAEQVYRDMGFDGYLAKPINSALLEAALLKYLPPEVVEDTTEEDDGTEGMENAIKQSSNAKKRRIAITADCICDLPKEWLEKMQIRLMHLYIYTKEGRFSDLFEVSSDSLLDYLKEEGNYARSLAAPASEYEYFFADVLEDAEQVLHITATSSLSEAYPNALAASKSFDNVTVVNSAHISSGHGLLVLHAAALAEEGKSVPEICASLEQFKNSVSTSFIVQTTENLYRNEKLSRAVYRACQALSLRPVLRMSQNKLTAWKMEIGNMKKASRKYVKQILHHSKQIDTRLLFFTYAGCTAHQVDELLEEVEKYVKFEQVVLQKASATVSSNCGVGAFGLIFIRKKG